MKTKKVLVAVLILIMVFCLTCCGSSGNKLDAKALGGHAFWYSTRMPDNRGNYGQVQILFDDDKTASVFLEDSGGWISGGDCSVKITSSTIILTSLDGDILSSPLANNGTYNISYSYDKKTSSLSMSFDDVQLIEGIAPFCLDFLD